MRNTLFILFVLLSSNISSQIIVREIYSDSKKSNLSPSEYLSISKNNFDSLAIDTLDFSAFIPELDSCNMTRGTFYSISILENNSLREFSIIRESTNYINSILKPEF